ncbi:MAG TPA: peroxiredoxin [Gemmataceae bacterium]|nr:peroxiredoxin [Gemmataceae bacterium]
MRSLRLLGLGVCVFGAFVCAGSYWLLAAQGEGPKVGDKAPAFQSVDEAGKVWKSGDHVGKKIVVLYFYPADFTGGCTAQACGFRDNLKPLTEKGVEVVGVSGDTPMTHTLFKKHHKLGFTLLADEKGELAKLFGVPHKVGKGKATGIDETGNKVAVFRGATIQRYTVIIDRDGKIAAKYQVAKAGDDNKRVLEEVQKLQTK